MVTRSLPPDTVATMHRAALLASLLPAAFAAGSCPSGAYIIVARASGEPAGYGIIGGVKDQLLSMVPGSDSEAVDYPATYDNYFNSETEGVTAMRDDITKFIDGCPKTPVVLMGYSQGAQVAADALVGQDDKFFSTSSPANQSIDQKYASQVACVILMGDPSFTTTETFHVGNASHNGFFPRTNVQEFGTLGLTDKIQSYCDANDTYCDSGNSSIVHDSYVNEYGSQAASYCAKKLSGMGVSTGNSTGNGTSTGGSNSSATYTASSPTATGGSGGSGSGSGSGGASATGSSSGAASTGSSGSSPIPASSSDAAPLADLRFMGVVAGVLVAGFFALM
jgi:acetylxylan esterase